MRRGILKLGFILCALFCFTCAHAGVGGQADRREVIGWLEGKKPWYCENNPKCHNVWNTSPYWNYVFIYRKNKTGKVTGTGEWISPKHILTNKHVANGCGIDGRDKCHIVTSDNKDLLASVVEYPGDYAYKNADKATDWSILEIENYTSTNWFEYVVPTPLGATNLWRAGFGGLNVLTAKEIKDIRAAYMVWLKDLHNYSLTNAKSVKALTTDMQKIDLHYVDTDKVMHDIYADKKYYKKFLEEFKKITGKDFMKDYMGDIYTLKISRNCKISTGKYAGMASHNCQSWGGDSGSSVQNAANRIALLNNSGSRYITYGNTFINQGILTQGIFNVKVETLINGAKIKEQLTKYKK